MLQMFPRLVRNGYGLQPQIRLPQSLVPIWEWWSEAVKSSIVIHQSGRLAGPRRRPVAAQAGGPQSLADIPVVSVSMLAVCRPSPAVGGAERC
jgi:hypothetical protein